MHAAHLPGERAAPGVSRQARGRRAREARIRALQRLHARAHKTGVRRDVGRRRDGGSGFAGGRRGGRRGGRGRADGVSPRAGEPRWDAPHVRDEMSDSRRVPLDALDVLDAHGPLAAEFGGSRRDFLLQPPRPGALLAGGDVSVHVQDASAIPQRRHRGWPRALAVGQQAQQDAVGDARRRDPAVVALTHLAPIETEPVPLEVPSQSLDAVRVPLARNHLGDPRVAQHLQRVVPYPGEQINHSLTRRRHGAHPSFFGAVPGAEHHLRDV
mmetsp:Transcript_14829/g.62597  ORF Transcript_14829/g.62597 Transcript_14829/m.62597 type:complete len:269 (-) Transcript_14829:865-1671(-)